MPAPNTQFPWRFEVCKACGRNNVAGFRVTDSMWDRVMSGRTYTVSDAPPHATAAVEVRPYGVVCIFCFDTFAAERGIDWTEEPIEFYCVSTIANEKWDTIEDVTPRPVPA